MNQTTKQAASPARRTIALERTFEASLEEVWELWTTKDGIEAWWGPDGFRVEVRSLELRPGGKLHYAMIAAGADQIEFMKKAGLPVITEHAITFVEVTPPRRLAYRHAVDFIPDVEPYDLGHLVELFAEGGRVRMVLSIEAMHDEQSTNRAVSGWESELGKLAKALESRAGGKA